MLRKMVAADPGGEGVTEAQGQWLGPWGCSL